jgi:hypothetical protein
MNEQVAEYMEDASSSKTVGPLVKAARLVVSINRNWTAINGGKVAETEEEMAIDMLAAALGEAPVFGDA